MCDSREIELIGLHVPIPQRMLVFAFFFFTFFFTLNKTALPAEKKDFPLSLPCPCMQATRYVAFTFEGSRKPDMQGWRAISELHAASFFIHYKHMCGTFQNLHPRPPPLSLSTVRTIVRLNRRSFDHWLPRERSCIDKNATHLSV